MHEQINYPKYRRRSIRLKGYDYSTAGAYFITICSHKYCTYFEDSDVRGIIEDEWLKTARMRPDIAIDNFVIMPNHFHAIILIKASHIKVGASCRAPLQDLFMNNSQNQTLGKIINGFKAAVTKRVNIEKRAFGSPLWQRNYFEHIIRSQNEFDKIREYIRNNPSNLHKDEYYAK